MTYKIRTSIAPPDDKKDGKKVSLNCPLLCSHNSENLARILWWQSNNNHFVTFFAYCLTEYLTVHLWETVSGNEIFFPENALMSVSGKFCVPQTEGCSLSTWKPSCHLSCYWAFNKTGPILAVLFYMQTLSPWGDRSNKHKEKCSLGSLSESLRWRKYQEIVVV